MNQERKSLIIRVAVLLLIGILSATVVANWTSSVSHHTNLAPCNAHDVRNALNKAKKIGN